MPDIVIILSLIMSITSLINSIIVYYRLCLFEQKIKYELANVAKPHSFEGIGSNIGVLEKPKESIGVSFKEEDVPIRISKIDRPAVTFGVEGSE